MCQLIAAKRSCPTGVFYLYLCLQHDTQTLETDVSGDKGVLQHDTLTLETDVSGDTGVWCLLSLDYEKSTRQVTFTYSHLQQWFNLILNLFVIPYINT